MEKLTLELREQMTEEIKHKFSGLLSINRPNGTGGGYDIETNHIVPPAMGSNVSSRANSVHSGSLKTHEDGSGRHPLQAELEVSAERLNEMNALNRSGGDGEGDHYNEKSSPRHSYGVNGESTPFGLSNNNTSNNNNNNGGGYSSEKEQRTPDEDVRKRRFDNGNRIRFPASISAAFRAFRRLRRERRTQHSRHTIT